MKRVKPLPKPKPIIGLIANADLINENKKQFGEMIKAKRLHNKFTLDHVSEQLSINKSQLVKDEMGLNNIVFSRLVKYMVFYAITFDSHATV